MMNQVKTSHEITAIRQSGQMLAAVLEHIATQLVVGISGQELAAEAVRELKKLGGRPAFLGYDDYPDVICISVNDEVVHGIPSDYRFKGGDVVGLDFGVDYQGMITDGAITVGVGELTGEVSRLIKATREALGKGIEQVSANARIGDISAAIEKRLRADGLGVVEELIGHGVGHSLHEEPGIPNYGRSNTGMRLKSGMTLAIEPMATLGGPRIKLDDDGWTIRTADGSLAAHFEHTVLVTDSGVEILTVA